MGRRSNDISLNLDSLMDTLTNVVGFLVILMALLQLGVGQAVQEIIERDLLPPASPTELALAETNAAKLADRIQELEARQAALAAEKSAAVAAREKAEQRLAALRTEPANKSVKPAAGEVPSPATLEKALADFQKKLDDLKARYAAAVAAIARLESQLASVPAAPGNLPAKIINLPNPRPAPEGAKPLILLCREGRIIPYDQAGLKETAQKAATFAARARPNSSQPPVVDCQKMVAYFAERNLGDRWFRLQIRLVNFEPILEMQRKPNAGETLAEASRNESDFLRAARLTLKSKNFIRFWVWNDSFETYLEARQLVDRLGVPAGWEARGITGELTQPLGLAVTCQGKPAPPPAKPAPPPDPNAPPPKPAPKPPPKDEID